MIKTFPLCHMLLVPLITGLPNGFGPPMVVIGPQSLRRIRPLVGLQPWKNKKKWNFVARAHHVNVHPRRHFYMAS